MTDNTSWWENFTTSMLISDNAWKLVTRDNYVNGKDNVTRKNGGVDVITSDNAVIDYEDMMETLISDMTW